MEIIALRVNENISNLQSDAKKLLMKGFFLGGARLGND